MDAVNPNRWLPHIRDVVGEARLVRTLSGGEEASVYQLDADAGAIVLHIAPAWRTRDELTWVHRLIQQVKTHVPEAVVPLGTPGQTVIELDGHLAAVYPFVEGTRLDREDPALCAQAAQCLARIHLATSSGSIAPRPVSPTAPQANLPEALKDPSLDAWWQSSEVAALRRASIHGDYYRGNLLCRDRQLVGVLDWHDAHVAPLALELAAATFELCKTDAHTLNLDRAADFVQAYRDADGPVPLHELAFLIPLMRVWIREDARRALLHSDTPVELAYAEQQVEAFQTLRTLRPDAFVG